MKRVFMDILGRLLGHEKELLKIRFDDDTFEITEKEGVKTMRYNGVVYSRINNASVYTNGYWDYFIPLTYVYPNPRMLMIGLGGGTVPFQLGRLLGDSIELDIIEVNKGMVNLYPAFIKTNLRYKIMIGEGSEYVAKTNDLYDVIMLDAYENDKIPEQFLNDSFVEHSHAALKDKGILAINCIGSMLEGQVADYAAKLRKKFDVYRIDTAEVASNVMLICTKNTEIGDVLKSMKEKIQPEDSGYFLIKGYDRIKRVYQA